MALGGGAPDIVDDELVSCLLQIGRHAGTHRAEPDKTDFHLNSPSLRNSPPPAVRERGFCGLALREHVLSDLRRRHRCRPARIESEMRDDLADLLLGDT